MKNIIKLMIICLLFVSCGRNNNYKLRRSSKLELRQLVQKTDKEEITTASFFILSNHISQENRTVTTIDVFAKVEGRFRFIKIPIEMARITIVDSIKIPNIEVEYLEYRNIGDEKLLDDYWITKKYIINCPEKYIPEKLLPIEL